MRRRAQGGLTLIEMLVTIALLGSILVVISATMRDARRTIKSTHEMQRRWHSVRAGLNRMIRDIQQAYVSFNERMSETNRRTYFRFTKGDHGEELRFSAFSHRRLVRDADESDQCIIQYFIDADPDKPEQKSLFRRETRRMGYFKPEDLKAETWVAVPNVVGVRYEFWDPTKDQWLETWDTTTLDGQPNRLPSRVRIYLTIADTKGREITMVSVTAPTLTEPLNLVPSGALPTTSVPGRTPGTSRTGRRTGTPPRRTPPRVRR